MREVYRSLRVEQVEGAARLLGEAGIETSIQNGRSYKGARRRQFSYRDDPESAKAAVLYVVHNSDLPEARRLLREAGLMAPGQRESYLPDDLRFRARSGSQERFWTPGRLRTLLLALIALSLLVFQFRGLFGA
ncbi:MAG: pathogenicity-like protein [Silanimonas lenta]|jgi:hypothetical protein